MKILSDLLLCLFYVVSCVNLGVVLLRVLGVKSLERITPDTQVATAFLLGQCGLVVIWTGLGLLAHFSRAHLLLILSVCLLGGLISAWTIYVALIKYLWNNLQALSREPLIWQASTILILILIGAEGLTAFVTPPTGDSEAFYLPLAKVLAASEHLVPLPGYEAFSQVGLFGEFHFAALLSVGALESAKLFVWFTALAAVVLLNDIGSQAGLKIRGKLLTMGILLTSSTFVYYISDGKVDIFAAALGLAAYFWALQVRNVVNPSSIALTGFFAGMSVLAKLSYMVALLPAVFLLALWRHLAESQGYTLRAKLYSAFKLGGGMALCAALPLILNAIKNVILFSQPLAPFVVPAGTQSWIVQTWFAPDITRWILMTYPFSLVFGQYPMQGGGLSVLLLAFVPFVFFLPRPRSLLTSTSFQLAATATAGVILWLTLRPSIFAPRYLLSTLLVFIPLITRAVEHYVQIESSPRWLSALIAFSFVLTLSVNIYERMDFVAAEVRAFFVDGEISCIYDGCGVWRKANKKLELGDRVYMANYYRFWLRPDLLQCVSNTKEEGEFSNINSPMGRWNFLFDHGFHYVVLDKTTHAQTIAGLDMTRVPDWLDVTVLVQDGDNTLLHIESIDRSRRPSYFCQQIYPPAWEVVQTHE